MITEQDADKAVHWLKDNATEAAEARAQHTHLDRMKEVMISRIAGRSEGSSEAEKRRNALASEQFGEYLMGLREAEQKDHEFRNLRAAAEKQIDFWISWQAYQRATKI